MEEGERLVRRLVVIPTWRDGLSTVSENGAELFRVLWPFALVLVALNVAGIDLEEWAARNQAGFLAVQAVVGAAFDVSCYRLLILGPVAIPPLWSRVWSKRILWYLVMQVLVGLSVVLVLIGLVVVAVIAIAVAGIDLSELPRVVEIALAIPVVVAVGYAFARWLLVLPAVAVDAQCDLSWAWRSTRSNGLRLAVIVLAPTLVSVSLELLGELGGMIVMVLGSVLSLLISVFGSACTALCFQFLAGRDASGVEGAAEG